MMIIKIISSEKYNERCLHEIVQDANNLYEQIMIAASSRIDQYNQDRTEFQVLGYGHDQHKPSVNLSKKNYVRRNDIQSTYRDYVKNLDFNKNNMTGFVF